MAGRRIVLWREGWLGSARRTARKRATDHGANGLAKLARRRANDKLDKPYGRTAGRLRIGAERPSGRDDFEAALTATGQPPDPPPAAPPAGAPSDEPYAELEHGPPPRHID